MLDLRALLHPNPLLPAEIRRALTRSRSEAVRALVRFGLSSSDAAALVGAPNADGRPSSRPAAA